MKKYIVFKQYAKFLLKQFNINFKITLPCMKLLKEPPEEDNRPIVKYLYDRNCSDGCSDIVHRNMSSFPSSLKSGEIG